MDAMNIGVIGCGYVFDLYMATVNRHPGIAIKGVADRNADRARQVGQFYGLKVYEDATDLLADPCIAAVANLTSIESHYEVCRAALLAGKHVYSEKPFTMRLDEARDLVTLAESRGLRISCAPSNALSPTVRTLRKAVQDGVVGDVRLVYAEFDDNPVYLMRPDTWRSRSGAPWPYLHEFEMGCTWEHVGYHLAWMCAMFGPVRAVTAFSKCILPDKTSVRLDPPDTPDFSVACLDFECGVAGRITCSIAAPSDHRMRIIGNKGILVADTYRDYTCPVYLEPYRLHTLKAHNLRAIRGNVLVRLFMGLGGRRIPLIRNPLHGATGRKRIPSLIRSPRRGFRTLRNAMRGVQDKSIGLAELADAIDSDRPHFPSHTFTLHLTELTLAIQAAGPDGVCHRLATRFTPPAIPVQQPEGKVDYRRFAQPAWLPRLVGKLLDRKGG